MQDLYELFIKDRRYCKGVSTRTEGWYRQSLKAFKDPILSGTPQTLSRFSFLQVVEHLHQRGVSPITINTYARAINAFLKWLFTEGHCPALIKVPKLKEPETIVRTLRRDQVEQLSNSRPTCMNERRALTLALLILDTGVRLKEGLSLQPEDIDLDNLLITIRDGKGGKQRVVPISSALRKILFKYIAGKPPSQLLFCAKNGKRLLQNNVRRDFQAICTRLHFPAGKGGFHALRHTFAVNYIRGGGDAFRLQRILGHSTLDMTRRYVNLQTEDLQAVHDKLSLLTRR